MTDTKVDLALPGQIEVGPGMLRPIVISELSETYCRLRESLPAANASGPLQLWVGAIGPFYAHVAASSSSELEFDGALHPEIVAHFCAS